MSSRCCCAAECPAPSADTTVRIFIGMARMSSSSAAARAAAQVSSALNWDTAGDSLVDVPGDELPALQDHAHAPPHGHRVEAGHVLAVQEPGPEAGDSKPSSRRWSVDSPEPDGPTNATFSPCRVRKETPSMAFGSGGPWRKVTFAKSMSPWRSPGSAPRPRSRISRRAWVECVGGAG